MTVKDGIRIDKYLIFPAIKRNLLLRPVFRTKKTSAPGYRVFTYISGRGSYSRGIILHHDALAAYTNSHAVAVGKTPVILAGQWPYRELPFI
jgi:hypothetical protein